MPIIKHTLLAIERKGKILKYTKATVITMSKYLYFFSRSMMQSIVNYRKDKKKAQTKRLGQSKTFLYLEFISYANCYSK